MLQFILNEKHVLFRQSKSLWPSKAYLTEANLGGNDLSGSNLTWANLSKANLNIAYLTEAILSKPKSDTNRRHGLPEK